MPLLSFEMFERNAFATMMMKKKKLVHVVAGILCCCLINFLASLWGSKALAQLLFAPAKLPASLLKLKSLLLPRRIA